MKQEYTAENMQALDDISHIRLRYGMYVGSVDDPTHIVIEILANAIDEANLGYGNTINIEVKKDGYITVTDQGRGIPHGKDSDGDYILRSVYDKLHMGGKFDTKAYANSLGQNSVGAKATNALSEHLTATSIRDGIAETVTFKQGRFIDFKSVKSTAHSGTIVTFKPDGEIFKDIHLDLPKFKNLLQQLSYLIKGVSFVLKTENTTNTYLSQNGMKDYMDFLCSSKVEMVKSRAYKDVKDGNNEIEIYLTYTDDNSETIKLFANNGENDSGTHLTAFKSAMTRTVNKYAREVGLLKDSDDNLSGKELENGRLLILNLKWPGIIYDSQTKTRVDDSNVRGFVNQVTTDMLNEWLESNPVDAKTIIDRALQMRKATEAAKKARESVLKPRAPKKEKALRFDSKLADCYGKNRAECEIYVTEGDSAAGNLKAARDNKTVAVLPVRGKILNTEKASYEKIRANAEIMTMIEAFGLTLNEKTMKLTYNKSDLRYGKIVIASDSDVDGSHIKNLFYTFIWNFCPQLIEDGYVYALIAPLYRLTIGKDKYIYLKDENALEAYKKKNPNVAYKLSRNKGLGELSIEETEECLLDKNNRILKQITVKDAAATTKLFNDLMGSEVEPRKDFITAHASEARVDV